jgi:hypothetical protein
VDAIELVNRKLDELLVGAAARWKGYEQLAVLEIARALDVDAFYRRDSAVQGREDRARARILNGVSYALKPFIAVASSKTGGVPWVRSSRREHAVVLSYLNQCSKIARIQRLLTLERYGLARPRVLNDKHIQIETSYGAQEVIFQFFAEVYRGHMGESAFLRPRPGWLQKRMHRYVEYDAQFGIRYDNDLRIVNHYKDAASVFGLAFFEGEALPPSATIGGRSFADWRQVCDEALGRVVCHTDFASILATKSPAADFRSAITNFGFRRDVAAVWVELGLNSSRVESTFQALTLDPYGLDAWDRDFEPPAPFYIPYSRDALLMPSFGGLANPYYAMFRHLRTEFRSDWDRAVEGREAIFRADIAKEFPTSRYLVPPAGVWLKRSDGSRITDIDAVVLDRETGSLGLFQLKWQDPFGVSLIERASRAKNLYAASIWVERVNEWIDGRSSACICDALGLPNVGGSQPPTIFVMSRYIARFSGCSELDARATWLGWPELVSCMRGLKMNDPIAEMAGAVAGTVNRMEYESFQTTLMLGDLKVQLFVNDPS